MRGASARVWHFTGSRSGTFPAFHALGSAGSSKFKIRTSSPYKANLALYGDEVRILIFDDPAELHAWQRPKFCFVQVYSTSRKDSRTVCSSGSSTRVYSRGVDLSTWSFPVSQMLSMTILQSILLYIILLLCINVHTVMVVTEQALHTKWQR